MADFKQNYFQKRTKARGPRSNNRITSNEVQVIASDGENLGILNLNEAINKAKNEGLDLIEIAPNAKPPVCKIMDMGKYKYDAQKKAFFCASYLYLPISIILQTGGFAFGAISIKSKPSFFALLIASFKFKIPKFSPSLAIT